MESMTLGELMKQTTDLLKALLPAYKFPLALVIGFGLLSGLIKLVRILPDRQTKHTPYEPEDYGPWYPKPESYMVYKVNRFKHRFSQKKVR